MGQIHSRDAGNTDGLVRIHWHNRLNHNGLFNNFESQTVVQVEFCALRIFFLEAGFRLQAHFSVGCIQPQVHG